MIKNIIFDFGNVPVNHDLRPMLKRYFGNDSKAMDKFDIFRLLDGRVISCEEHSIKPEKEIYLRLCAKYGLNPSECIFTDDRAINVEGAKAVGMKAVIFTDCYKFISDIEHGMDRHRGGRHGFGRHILLSRTGHILEAVFHLYIGIFNHRTKNCFIGYGI